MMEQDLDEMAELLGIFQAESAEHVQTITRGILVLEKEPDNREVLEEIFRAAHSLKGAARLIGLKEIEEISHKMEDTLNATRKGEIRFEAQTGDVILQGLDRIRDAVDRLGGAKEDGQAPLAEVGQRLENAISQGAEPAAATPAPPESGGQWAPAPPPAPEPPRPQVPVPQASVPAPTPAEDPAARPAPREERGPAPPGGGRAGTPQAVTVDETIRVTTKKLDILMNQVSELITNRINTEHHLLDLKSAVADLEDWRREWSAFKHHSRAQQLLAGEAGQKVWGWLEHYHQRASDLSEHLQVLSRKLDDDMQHRTISLKEVQDSVSQLRLLPLATLFDQFHRLVRDLARQEKKEIDFVVEGAETQIDKRIIEEIKDPLVHLLRNCVDHGIEEPETRVARSKDRAGKLFLRAYQSGNSIIIDVGDDGRGFDYGEIREAAIRKGFVSAGEAAALSEQEVVGLIFLPGFSTTRIITDVSGRGVGMNVVKTNIERIKGTIAVLSTPGRGATFRLQLPLTIATTYILLFRCGQRLYALPTSSIKQVLMLEPAGIRLVESRRVLQLEGVSIAVAGFADLLGVQAEPPAERVPTVILGAGEKRLAVMVDEIVGDQEVVIRNFRHPLKRVRHLAGAATLSDGTLALVVNPSDLLRTAEREERGARPAAAAGGRGRQAERTKMPRVLIVDDSITTRTLEKNILRSAGYDVSVAVDGQEALALLAEGPYDIVVSDVEMPKVDGFQLTASIKGNEKYSHMPVILVTSLQSDAHRRRGLEVGADAYITKGSFDQNNLLDTIRRLT